MAAIPIVVTLTGVHGEAKKRCLAALECLGVAYCGDLRLGVTTHVVCAPGSEALAGLKAQVALSSGLPLVLPDWLEASSQAGALVDWEDYQVAPASLSTTKQQSPSPERLRAAPLEDPGCWAPGQFMPAAASPGQDGGAPPLNGQTEIDEAFKELSVCQPESPLDGASPLQPPASGSPPLASGRTSSGDATVSRALARMANITIRRIGTLLRRRAYDEGSTPSGCLAGGAAAAGQVDSGAAFHHPCSPALAGLPLPSAVELGAALGRPPHRLVAEAVVREHGLGSIAEAEFHSSATLITPSGQRLSFTAGDTSHCGKLLYDVAPQQHAYVVIHGFYALKGEAYIAHAYFFSVADMEQRPAWAAWLRRQARVAPEELILSSGLYLSPAGLLVGECGVVYRPAERPLAGPVPPHFPLYECRRAFDAAMRTGTPLPLALREFETP